jgi:hypothetical protein
MNRRPSLVLSLAQRVTKCVVAFLALACVIAPAVANAHPLHTTMTEVTLDPSRHVVHIVIRAFADDFLKAVTVARKPAHAPTADGTDASAYVQSAFIVSDGSSRLALRACGTRQSADLLWICVEVNAPSDLTRLTIQSSLLWNLFDDQVNIVRATIVGAPRSILFTKGDAAKPLVAANALH